MQAGRLIVFLIPPRKMVNGGILSIFSICAVSREFTDVHGAEVFMATYPGYKSYRKNDLFNNDETIYSFQEIVERGVPSSLILHIPEYASTEVYEGLKKRYGKWLASIPELHVNIMDQNIWMMPQPTLAASWLSLTPNVTQTTAHDKYTTQEMANHYFMPTHHFSTFVDPSQYQWVPYAKKDKLIVLSPDVVDQRPQIVAAITKSFPDYEVVTIQNMTYETYKETMSRAKFAVTFGEGFDGYYVEAFFCGGIAYAVYNEKFFPDSDFAGFANTYSSYDDMLLHIAEDMHSHDKKDTYEKINQQNFKKITELYSYANYKQNIKKFYQKKYTFIPELAGAKNLIATLVREREDALTLKIRELKARDKAIAGQSEMIRERDDVIKSKEDEIYALQTSLSWRMTEVLRRAAAARNRINRKKDL